MMRDAEASSVLGVRVTDAEFVGQLRILDEMLPVSRIP
jgi:hypothetical protein